MYTLKFAKKWIILVICSLVVSLSGLAIVVYLFKNQLVIERSVATSAKQPILNNLIAGHLAENRDQPLLAADYYLAAAKLSNNSQLAIHAMAIGYRVHHAPLLLKSSHLNYQLSHHSPESSYLYAYSLLLNHRVKESIAIYAHLFQNKTIHIEDYTPLVPKEITKEATFKQTLNHIVPKFSDNASALTAIAIMYHEIDDTPSAMKTNDLALQLAPDNHIAIQNKVLFYIEEKKPALAIAYLQDTLKKFPDDDSTKGLLATLYYDSNQFTLAKPLFEQLLSNPEFASQSALYLGEIARLEQNDTLAEKYLLQARLDKTLQPFADLLLGDISLDNKQYDKAITWYKNVSQDPYYFQAQLAIAKALYLKGDGDAAHQFLQTVIIKDDQEFTTLVRFETALYFMQKDWLGARDYLYKAVKALPDNVDIMYALVITDEQLGHYDEAKDLLTQTLEINPNHVASLNAMGELLAMQYQQYSEAETYLHRALTLEPNNTSTLHTLGWLYYQTHHYDQAVTLLQRAYSLNKSPLIAADLGEVLWADGQTQQATSIWNNALKTNPHNPQLKATMKRFLP